VNRRRFLQGFAVGASGLLVPDPTILGRRFWSLDRTMVAPDPELMIYQRSWSVTRATVASGGEGTFEWLRKGVLAEIARDERLFGAVTPFLVSEREGLGCYHEIAAVGAIPSRNEWGRP